MKRRFVTEDGKYYESTEPIDSSHIEIHSNQPINIMDQPEQKTTYSVGQDTKLNITVSDLIKLLAVTVLCFSAYNNLDNRMAKMEEKTTNELVTRIARLEESQKSMQDKQEVFNKQLSSQLTEIENLLLRTKPASSKR